MYFILSACKVEGIFYLEQQVVNKEGSVPCFESVEDCQKSLQARHTFEPVDLYHRDSSSELYELEDRIARFTRSNAAETVVYASGMTAVTSAITTGLAHAEQEERPTIACAQQTYGQTKRYVNCHLAQDQGARVVWFDSGNAEDTQRVIETHQPNIIISETIGNGPEMPILDIPNLLRNIRALKNRPVTILDNTLPLSTELPVHEYVSEEDNVIVAESGTKSYAFNREMLGIAYSKNLELITHMRQQRRALGTAPGIYSQAAISTFLPENIEAFDARNQKIYENNATLAEILHAVPDETGFSVSHPSLPTHDNYKLAAERGLAVASPMLFLICTADGIDQFQLSRKLYASEAVREQVDISQSFSFDRTKLLPDEHNPSIRISCGYETDVQRLGKALIEASAY